MTTGSENHRGSSSEDFLPALKRYRSRYERKFPYPQASPLLAQVFEQVRKDLAYGSSETAEEGMRRFDREKALERIKRHALHMGFEISSFERDEILHHLEISCERFGPLQEFVNDPRISDIIVRHFDAISVRCGEKILSTDARFSSQQHYERFVEQLLMRAGSSYSTRQPISDGMLGNFARIHVVHSCLCEQGPYLTIRINRFASIRLEQLQDMCLAPLPMMQYLSELILTGHTMLLIGEVGSGKTTLARALAAKIPRHESILVIEDTPEIRLEHPEVRYLSTRHENADGAGRVSPGECIRAGMRMAMNRIIFGEIRDAEAAEAFVDVCSSGHPGLTTLHGKSCTDALVRLELFLGRSQRGVGRDVLREQISTAVQAVVFMQFCPFAKQRRIMEVVEVGGVADGTLRRREMFRYDAHPDGSSWKVLSKSSMHIDMQKACRGPLPNRLYVGEAQSFPDENEESSQEMQDVVFFAQ